MLLTDSSYCFLITKNDTQQNEKKVRKENKNRNTSRNNAQDTDERSLDSLEWSNSLTLHKNTWHNFSGRAKRYNISLYCNFSISIYLIVKVIYTYTWKADSEKDLFFEEFLLNSPSPSWIWALYCIIATLLLSLINSKFNIMFFIFRL